MPEDIESLLAAIRQRHATLPPQSAESRHLVTFLRSIATAEPMDYPEISDPEFPASLFIAHTVCHPDCGSQQFIVDGGPQLCDYCGRHLYRGETASYQKTTNPA